MEQKEIMLIFGGSGTIGRAILSELIRVFGDKFELVSTYFQSEQLDLNITWFYCDVLNYRDSELFVYLKGRKVKYVFFCIGTACRGRIATAQEDKIKEIIEINSISFFNLYKALFECCTINNKTYFIILSSTVVTYHRENYGIYIASKILLESFVKSFAKERGDLKHFFMIVRLSIIDSRLAQKVVNWNDFTTFNEYIVKHLKGKILNVQYVANYIIERLVKMNTDYDIMLTLNGAEVYEEKL